MQDEIQKKLEKPPTSESFPVKPLATMNGPPQAPSRIVKYQDLPYMGEMTLDNSKPRRGRKPKKADICHLIYKNYGTIFPGTPNPKSLVDKEAARRSQTEANCDARSDVQNKIISSLLEKRLTQENKRQREKSKKTCEEQDEPLNLCVRDLNQLKIRLYKKGEDVYSKHEDSKSEASTSDEEVEEKNRAGGAPNGYVYWPTAGVFVHPMALQQQLLYYQRLTQNNGPRPPPEVSASDVRVQKKSRGVRCGEDVPPEAKPKRSSSGEKAPAKRKRSAIFIPPIPAENQNNPATEVSICKFKFTGGAKPSLQEKKMLSVDSGGNFRYYSGTGDKSMRGYEFFPRETLQQQIGNCQGSSTGAFLQASGEKINPSALIDFTGKQAHADFMLSPEIPATLPKIAAELSPRMKKRKSRKSLQREKLEQTFKEKGFLIQTQKLESAQGATYCKFRQLRKFTRYLFRSWKDYLPGNVGDEERSETDEVTEQELETLRNLAAGGGVDSPEPSSS